MICLFGTGVAGSNLLFEITLGSYERVLASPLRRSSILIGKSLKELAPLVVQAALVTLVCIPFGFVLYPLHVLVGLLILGVFGVGMGAFSNALAVAVRKREWMFWAVQQSLLFPLLILSGMLLPLEAGPRWIQVLGRVQPADLDRRRRAGAVRRLVRPTRPSAGRCWPRCSPAWSGCGSAYARCSAAPAE